MDKQKRPWAGPQFSKIHEDWEASFLGLKKLPIIIGLTGPTKSGKTIMAKRLVTEHGFLYESMSLILNRTAQMMGKYPIDWKILGEVGRLLRILEGKDCLAQITMKNVHKNLRHHHKFVVDSCMHPAEIDFFRKRTNFILIGIQASWDIRLNEYLRWYGGEKSLSEDVLHRRDNFEQYQVQRDDDYSPNIDLCFDSTPDYIINIDNSLSEDTVFKPIDDIVRNIPGIW